MNVLHIYRTCYPETKGGLEQAIRFICKACQQHNVNSTILTLGSEDKEYSFEGSKIVVVKKDFEIASNGFSFRLFKRFRQLCQTADIIHYQYPWPTGDLLSLIAPNKPALVSYQSDIIKQRILKRLYWPLEQLFFARINKVIASSPQYARSSKNLINHQHKVSIIPLAIDAAAYPRLNEQVRRKWQQAVGNDFFLFIGVLRYYKGLQYLLEAAKINQLPVVIAGDGPERVNLEAYVKKHNLSKVKIVGFIDEDDKVALHHLSKAFVFPSHLRSEAFGISLLEAQLYSKPIISADIGTGSSYVNIDNETGLIVEPANPTALALAMKTLADDPALAQKLGKQARIRFDTVFTIAQYADNYASIYKALLKQHRLAAKPQNLPHRH